MYIQKILSLSTITASLVLITGCTTQSTTNANTSNDNTNTVVTNSNENTNTDQVSETDTSDWLTYTNEEYGFSFKYPRDYTVELEDEPLGKVASSYGDIYIYSENYECYIQLNKPTSIEYDKVVNAMETGIYNNLPVKEVSFNQLAGISYTDTVNEQHEIGSIYKLNLSDAGFTYLIRSGVNNESCIAISDEILNTFLENS